MVVVYKRAFCSPKPYAARMVMDLFSAVVGRSNETPRFTSIIAPSAAPATAVATACGSVASRRSITPADAGSMSATNVL